jgi:nucleotide-binding universal stress UspA family protein
MSDFKVLLPLDGSRTAEHSLVYLSALQKMGYLQARLVSVVDDSEEPRGMTPDEADDRAENLQATYLRKIAGDIEEHAGIKLETKVLRGPPAERLIDEAREFAADLVVISTHGRSGTSRWRLGSVADKVIRGAERNTLVIGPKATGRETWLDTEVVPPFKSILLPIDGSGIAEQAIGVARQFAQAFESTVHIVRVVPVPNPAIGYGAEGVYVPDLLDQLVEAAKANVSDVCTHFGGTQVTAEVVVGFAASELENYVRHHDIDLVVMTSHGRGGFIRTALGSVTDRMLASGTAPVLVVRPAAQTS